LVSPRVLLGVHDATGPSPMVAFGQEQA
jgi:hypothetical protein